MVSLRAVCLITSERVESVAVRQILVSIPGARLVKDTVGLEPAIVAAKRQPPDAVVLPDRVELLPAPSVVRALRQHVPSCRALMMGDPLSADDALDLYMLGVAGQITWDDLRMIDLLRLVLTTYVLGDFPLGNAALPSAVLDVIARRAGGAPGEGTGDLTGGDDPRHAHGLTERQYAVWVLLARGLNTDQITQQLVLTSNTVSSHVNTVLAKLGVGSRHKAAALFWRHHDAGSGFTQGKRPAGRELAGGEPMPTRRVIRDPPR